MKRDVNKDGCILSNLTDGKGEKNSGRYYNILLGYIDDTVARRTVLAQDIYQPAADERH